MYISILTRYGSLYSSTSNCTFGKELTSFVSAIDSTSMIELITAKRSACLYRMEFTLMYAKVGLFVFFNLILRIMHPDPPDHPPLN